MAARRARTLRPLAGVLIGLVAACGEASRPETGAPATPLVLATFEPTRELAARLAGDLARVECDLPEGVDALFWEPDDAALRRMQAADLVVLHGAGMDAWAERASLPESRRVVTADRFREHWITFEGAHEHSHGGGAPHAHVGVDPHSWMDPLLWLEEARAIHAALARLLGEPQRAALDAHLAELESELRALHQGYARLVLPEGEALYASHPAYNYLAARHGWPIENLDLDPSAVPQQGVLDEIAQRLAERPGRFILWESEPIPDAAEALARLGLASVVLAPAETIDPEERRAGESVLAIQRANLERLSRALGVE